LRKAIVALVVLAVVTTAPFVAYRSGWLTPSQLAATWPQSGAQVTAAPTSGRPSAATGSASSPTRRAGESANQLQPASTGASANAAAVDRATTPVESGDLKPVAAAGSGAGLQSASLEAPLLEKSSPPRGFNIALAALGGKVESKTSEYDDHNWAADNLIDGMTYVVGGRGCRPACGWSSKDGTFPQEVVLSFHQGRETLIGAVIVDTTTFETIERSDWIAKDMEVWASTTNPTDGFSKMTAARLQRRPAEQLISFPPTRAKFVKLRFLSNYGASRTQVGEVKIIEAPRGPSILADLPKNLALPALGGAVVRFTSGNEHTPAGGLIDASAGSRGWRSANGPYGPESYLPQELVFAFRGEQTALVDRIVVVPQPDADPASRPKVISVSVSTETPFDGFQEVGQFALTASPSDQSFPVGLRARFVKLRILQNFGGRYTSLGKVNLIEGSAPAYESILLTEPSAGGRLGAATSPVDETGVAVEAEPNNSAAQANALVLGRRTKGTINPLGEQDYFKLTIPGTASSVLTLELLGRPSIRTSLTLLDPSGRMLKQFDPARLPGQQATFSWLVNPGDHFLQVTEPLVSMVLIWDTSGSMGKDSVESLKQAVEAYIGEVGPSERLNLIRFSNNKAGVPVEVLLPEFANDRQRLKTVAEGKFYADGGTPLYDAVAKGIELLEGAQGNRAIIVMTDGADTTSRLGYPGFWKLLDEKRIRIYTIGLGAELPAFVPLIGSTGGRVLGDAAAATNGRFFFARTPEELKGFYQQIATELRAISTYYLKATFSQGTGGLTVAATGERIATVSAPSQIELILDASGSMNERVEGRRKIDSAKDAMTQVIKALPDDAQVGLRVYGHRIREGRKGDCQDTELLVPFGKVDKAGLLPKVASIKALGTTLIDYSLRQVARDFGSTPGEKMVILVTDGKEECKGDPAAAVAELLGKGLKVRLNIIGFALADAATKRDMERVAVLTGGKFFDAKNAQALTQAIEQSLAVPYDVLDASGTRVGGGLTGQGKIDVPEGIYSVVVQAAGKPITIPNVRIAQNGSTKVALKKEGQEVGIQVLGP
jgi:Mg-chelatase subunit ChlD